MLSDIIAQAIKPEPDMTIVAPIDSGTDELETLLRRRRIDVVIFGADDRNFSDPDIARLLHAVPRLGLLAVDGAADQATLHHLVPVRDQIGQLAQSTVADAIRTGSALRRQ
jgi:hypothetical protein